MAGQIWPAPFMAGGSSPVLDIDFTAPGALDQVEASPANPSSLSNLSQTESGVTASGTAELLYPGFTSYDTCAILHAKIGTDAEIRVGCRRSVNPAVNTWLFGGSTESLRRIGRTVGGSASTIASGSGGTYVDTDLWLVLVAVSTRAALMVARGGERLNPEGFTALNWTAIGDASLTAGEAGYPQIRLSANATVYRWQCWSLD